MTVDNYLAEAGMFVGLAGILAGFSLAAVIQLLTANQSGNLTTAAIVIFTASSLMFLYGLIVAMSSFAAAAELNRVPTELTNISVSAFLSMVGAIYVFIGGIGLLGWLRSRTTGLLTTICAVISACLITYVISTFISLFM